MSLVYFFTREDRDLVKIGYTKYTPVSRQRQLQRNSFDQLVLIATFTGDRRLETYLHQQFAAHRVPWASEIYHFHADIDRWIARAKADRRFLTEERRTAYVDCKTDGGLSIERKPLNDSARRTIEVALHKANGNITRAAKQLGIHRQSLQRKLKRLGMAAT